MSSRRLPRTTYGQDLSWFIYEWVYLTGAPAYRYGWDTVNVGASAVPARQDEQTQIPAYPSVFTMPIDLRATINAAQQTLTVWNNADPQWFHAAGRRAGHHPAVRPGPVGTSKRGHAHDAHHRRHGRRSRRRRRRLHQLHRLLCGRGGNRSAGCEPVDFDGDGDVDCVDWEQSTLAWTQPGPGARLLYVCNGAEAIPALSTWGLMAMAACLWPAG